MKNQLTIFLIFFQIIFSLCAKEIENSPIPEEYNIISSKPGKLIKINYPTISASGENIEKDAIVYTPYDYNPDIKYDVLYLIHGGGESFDVVLGTENEPTILKKAIDYMIEKRELEPIIIVAPTFYSSEIPDSGGRGSAKDMVYNFQKELRKDLLPFIEKNYSVYTENDSNARNHRSIGGFSMGSVCTWYAFMENLDLFHFFIPLSGDSWVIEELGGGKYPEETAQLITESIEKQNFSPQDFFIFSASGKKDIAYPNLYPQIQAMKNFTNTYSYGIDLTSDNLYFLEDEEGIHWWPWIHKYLYNILPILFPSE